MAGQEDDASVEAVPAQPAIGVEAARSLRPEVDVQDRDAAMERALAETQQIPVAADAVAFTFEDRADEISEGRSKILVVVEEQHVRRVCHHIKGIPSASCDPP